MKRSAKSAVKLIVSIFFIYLILSKVDWQEALTYLRKVNTFNILTYLTVIILGMGISTFKWRILAEYKGFRLPFVEYFKLYITGALINNVVPSVVGGDVFRSYNLGKRHSRYFEATATVVMDRFTGLLSLMLMILLFSLLNPGIFSDLPALSLVNALIALALLAFGLFILVRRKSWARKLVRFAPEKVTTFLRELDAFGNDGSIFVRTVALSMVFNLFGVALANLILFWSLGIPIDVFDYLPVIFTVSIISAIPAGIGLKEWAYITLFGFLGINPAAAVVVALLNRFLQALVNIAALPIYLRNKQNIPAGRV